MSNIVVIGSANMDLTVGTDRIPAVGETVHGHGFMTTPGGKGVNQAVAAAKLGSNVTFIGALGCDSFGKDMLLNLEKHNITFEGEQIEGVSSGIAVITVCEGNNSIIIDSGANALVTPQFIDRHIDTIKNADYIIMQFEIPIETVKYITDIVKDSNTVVVVNPAPFVDIPKDIYEGIDILVPNEHEAHDLCGIYPKDADSCNEAVLKIAEFGVTTPIITLGGNGSCYLDGGEVRFQSAFKTTAVDTTAAGDSFIGGLVFALSEDFSLEEAVKYATAVSSITVSRRGASESVPTRAEADSVYSINK